MIDNADKIRLPTTNGSKLVAQVNWNRFVKGRFIKLILDGKEAIIPRESFVQVALMVGDEVEQEKMIPQEHFTIRHFKKNVTIRAQRDIKQNELISITVPFDVPLSDQAAEAMQKMKN